MKRSGPRWGATYRLFTHPESVRIARALVVPAAGLAGFPATDVLDIQVAVSEAVGNAFLHAYGGRRTGRVALDVEFDGAILTISIHDSGRPVTGGLAVPQSLPLRGEGGRGLYIIGRLMDSVEVRQPGFRGRGTLVIMKKRVQPSRA